MIFSIHSQEVRLNSSSVLIRRFSRVEKKKKKIKKHNKTSTFPAGEMTINEFKVSGRKWKLKTGMKMSQPGDTGRRTRREKTLKSAAIRSTSLLCVVTSSNPKA